MTISSVAAPIVIREILTGLEDAGRNQEWTDVTEIFQSLNIDQRIRLAVRIVRIFELSNALNISKRRL